MEFENFSDCIFTLVNVYALCWYLRVLPVLHRADVVGIFIFVSLIQYRKNMPYAKGTIGFNHFKYSVCAWQFM